MKPRILNAAERIFVRRLCQPSPFKPDAKEREMLERFEDERIVKVCRADDNEIEIEVTDFGADCYMKTLEA